MDIRLRTHDYLVILTIFIAIFAYLILDGKNELYQVMNVRTQVIILASLSVVACSWFLLAKGPVPQFLSMVFLMLFSLLVIRLLLSEMGITLLYCLLLFYAISVKLPKASGIPVSLILGGIILLLEGFRTLFGISFPPPSVSELWASRFLIISILIACHCIRFLLPQSSSQIKNCILDVQNAEFSSISVYFGFQVPGTGDTTASRSCYHNLQPKAKTAFPMSNVQHFHSFLCVLFGTDDLGASSGLGPRVPSPLPLSFVLAKRRASLCRWRESANESGKIWCQALCFIGHVIFGSSKRSWTLQSSA